jgi:uncharacterized protein YlxP (DUF503 family)
MVLAYAVFDIHLPGCRGLKEKRMVVKSLKTRIRNEFEVSAAEVGDQDLLQRAQLGVAAIGPDQEPLDALLQHILLRGGESGRRAARLPERVHPHRRLRPSPHEERIPP